MTLKKMVDAYRAVYVNGIADVAQGCLFEDEDGNRRAMTLDDVQAYARELWTSFYTIHIMAGLISHDTWAKFFDKCHTWDIETFMEQA